MPELRGFGPSSGTLRDERLEVWQNKMVEHYQLNEDGRDFIIGDLHGAYDALTEMLELIEFDKSKDRMFSVGDLVDRGPESFKCLLLTEEPWFIAVRGNHEDMMLDTIKKYDNGGDISQDYSHWVGKHTDNDKQTAAYLARQLPYVINVETPHGHVGICHAQPPTDDWNDTNDYFNQNMMVWGRDRVMRNQRIQTKNVDVTYHGHTPKPNVVSLGNGVWLDTGAVFNDGHLTAIDMTNLKTYGKPKDVYNLG